MVAFLNKLMEQSPSAYPVQLPETIPVDLNLIPNDVVKNKNNQEKVNGACDVSVKDKQEDGNNVGNLYRWVHLIGLKKKWKL